MKLLLTVFVFLATASIGFAARVQYSAKYKQGLNGSSTTTLATTIDDSHEATLIANLGTWSNNKYSCSKSRVTNIVLCKVVATLETKAEASGELQKMRELVCLKLKECRVPSPVP